MVRRKPEQTVQILHEADGVLASGKTIEEFCREKQISLATYYRWKKKYGGLSIPDAKRLKALEIENAKNKGRSGLPSLRRCVIAWAAIMSFYPFFQPGWFQTLMLLTKIEWRWPFLLLLRFPYLYTNRQSLNLRLDSRTVVEI